MTALGVVSDAWVISGASLGIFASFGYVVRGRKWIRHRREITLAKDRVIFGHEEVRDSDGRLIVAITPSLGERLALGEQHFADIDAQLREIADDLIGRNGKPVAVSLGELHIKIDEHVRDQVIHRG